MIFEPVTDKSAFDAATIELYKKRVNEPRQDMVLMSLYRPKRNYLPVTVDSDSIVNKMKNG